VTAVGNIDVAGSRIAAYNGGNIDVESLQGNVNAGTGGTGTAKFTVFNVDPVTGAVSTGITEVNGSGILATTLPGGPLSDRPGDITITTPRGDIVASQGGIIELALNGNNAAGPTVTLTAGTRDASGKVIYAGNIDVSGSGVVGETVNLSAAGNIKGLVVAQHNSTINAAAAFSGTVLAGGTANVSGQSISGTVIAVGGINASGNAAGATFLSQNAVNVGGQQVASGLATSVAASSTSQSAVQEDNATKNEAAQLVPTEDSDTKKHNKASTLKKIGRVTVILPRI
jgi:hypothetical protein